MKAIFFLHRHFIIAPYVVFSFWDSSQIITNLKTHPYELFSNIYFFNLFFTHGHVACPDR